jgi:16S rRNA (guanine966-N2)-methyltransferase
LRSQPHGNYIRIISGEWKSRRITFPSLDGLRPTPDRVRETVFNWLGQTLYGKTCLDLFAGSGALGFEALSRGAKQVVMVESAKPVLESLNQNAATLHAERLAIIRGDALQFLTTTREKFDVIFLDPPYRAELLPKLFPLLPDRLNGEGTVYFESDRPPEPTPGWKIVKKGRAGMVHFQLAQLVNES